jgi:pyruvate/2-oxoglutarate dehydrogenase complex dihydrolipoamide dehydrogenase (E3) component
MRMAERFDAIIVGTGQAGPPLAGRLTDAGWRCAIIERQRFGGTCVNYGCTPTKALVASARAAYMARRAADFGVGIEGAVAVDMAKVKRRKDKIAGRSNESITSYVKDMKHASVFEDHAVFEGDRRLRVGGETIEADKVFLNVGARAAIPPIDGLEEVSYLTNSSLLDLDTLPEHLIILGGGYVGVEFAQMYRRFGAEVTILDRAPRLMASEDEDVSQAIRAIFEAEGIAIVTGAEVERVARDGAGLRAIIGVHGKRAEIAGSHLLVAAGRKPNTDDLGLETTAIETDDKGFIRVDDRLRTSVEGVFALGDCNGRGAFTHTAYNDYEILAANLLDGDDRKVSDRFVTYAAYIDPPFARVGASESDLRAAGRKALVTQMPMTGVARARERSETDGFMKILVDPHTGRFLGASMVGIRCDEVIHAIVYLMYARATYQDVLRAVPIHPCVAELIPTMLKQLRPLE